MSCGTLNPSEPLWILVFSSVEKILTPDHCTSPFWLNESITCHKQKREDSPLKALSSELSVVFLLLWCLPRGMCQTDRGTKWLSGTLHVQVQTKSCTKDIQTPDVLTGLYLKCVPFVVTKTHYKIRICQSRRDF